MKEKATVCAKMEGKAVAVASASAFPAIAAPSPGAILDFPKIVFFLVPPEVDDFLSRIVSRRLRDDGSPRAVFGTRSWRPPILPARLGGQPLGPPPARKRRPLHHPIDFLLSRPLV